MIKHRVSTYKLPSGKTIEGKNTVPVLCFDIGEPGIAYGVQKWDKLLQIFADEENVKAIKTFVRTKRNYGKGGKPME